MEKTIEQNDLTQKVVEYITARGAEKLEKLDKTIAKLKASNNEADQAKLELEEQKRRDEVEKFIPANWLDDAARRAKQLQLVTHAPKFLNSDAKASGIYAVNEQKGMSDGTVSTSSIAKPVIDVIGNAAALDVGKLLQLSDNGNALIEHIAADDIDPLKPIAKNEEQAEQWLAGFKQAVVVDKLASHKLTKQVYWPVENNGENADYHLLAPLYATSMQHEVYQTINRCNFSEPAKEAKKAKKDKEYHDIPVVNFTDVAEQHFGGTKPQNISQLNSQRYGKSHLLSCSGPPQWETVKKPPLGVDTIFDKIFTHRAGKHATSLRWYLEHVFEKPSVVEIRDERAERVDRIIDLLFGYVGEVHQFEPGWSASPECRLPIEEQLLLDPLRREFDKDFLEHWDKKEWHEQVAARFSRWLNRHIDGYYRKSKQLATSDVEFKQWKQILKSKISALRRDFSDYYLDEAKEQA